MFRRIIAVLTASAMLSMIFCSCTGDDIAGVENDAAAGASGERPAEIESIATSDWGEIHNEVLTLYCSKHMPLSGERLDREEFTGHLSMCISTVFELRGIDFRVHPDHIEQILGEFERLKRAGVIDVCNPTLEGIGEYLDYEVERGAMEQGAAKEYERILSVCAERDAGGNAKNVTHDELKGTGNALRDEVFIDILASSRDFWTGLDRGEMMVTVLGDTIDPDHTLPEELLFEKIAAYMTDAVMGLACIVAIPLTMGASIAGLISSIAASIAIDYMWEEMQDDYDCEG